MRAVTIVVLLAGWPGLVEAWVGAGSGTPLRMASRSAVRMQAEPSTRRDLFKQVGLAGGAAALAAVGRPELAAAEALSREGKSTVLVAGATGQTGSRVCSQLASVAGVDCIAGVRSVDKAQKAGLAAKELRPFDVAKSVDQLAAALEGVDAVVCAVGFVPGNPLQMGKAAHEVDNLGTCRLIDAAKQANVKKFVLVSSILTNGRNWGQEKSPGFVITNAFGGVLDEKIVAENYLRASGLDFSIVRPGGLQATPPKGELVVSAEDTLNSGEVSRDTVAAVCIEALFAQSAKNKVVEIIESEDSPALTKSDWFGAV